MLPSSRHPITISTAILALMAFTSLLATELRKSTGAAIPNIKKEQPAFANFDPAVKYVGDDTCGACHGDIFESFKKTAMGRTMALPSAENAPGISSAGYEFENKKLGRRYAIYWKEGKLFHRESARDENGREIYSQAQQVHYAVGAGEQGWSYFVMREGRLFVSPISYYANEKKWDVSPGFETVNQGFSRPVAPLCADCHSGGARSLTASSNRYSDPPFTALSINCERCHGPGEIHVAQRRQGKILRSSIDHSIVNPAKIPAWKAENICMQCHLTGDARVLKPGKSWGDFRPGMALDDVYAVFSLRPKEGTLKFDVLGHFGQLQLSQCSIHSKGKLSCLTCHNPHLQLEEKEQAAYYRQKCEKCHRSEACKEELVKRQMTSPPNNCISCHMRKRQPLSIDHVYLTDHRISRHPHEPLPRTIDGSSIREFPELVHETKKPGQENNDPGLRTLWGAFKQIAASHPEYEKKATTLLQEMARVYPDDPEVLEALGQFYLSKDPRTGREEGARILEKAIQLGSNSPRVREALAIIRAVEGKKAEARLLLEAALRLDDYYIDAYPSLAMLYLDAAQPARALQLLQRALEIQPQNQEVRQMLNKLSEK